MIPGIDGRHDNVNEELYHADRGSISYSGAKLLLPPGAPPKPNPEKFRWEMDHQKFKKVWDFGHIAHRLVLRKGTDFTVLDPAVDGLKADGTLSDKPGATAKWKAAEAKARAEGKTPISLELYRNAEEMAGKVSEHPLAGPLFAHGQAEVTFYHTDPETGVRLRGRADWITQYDWGDGAPRLTVVDYKTSTSADPDELKRKFWQLGYFRQFAWYHDLILAVHGVAPVFVFVAQCKEPPHQVAVLEYTAADLDEGRAQNRQAINIFAVCRATDKWPGPPGSEGLQSITLPPYAYRRTHLPTVSDWISEADEEEVPA